MTLKLKLIGVAFHVCNDLLDVRLHALKLCMLVRVESLLRLNVLILLLPTILLLTLEKSVPS